MERRQAERWRAVFEDPPPFAMPLAEIWARFSSNPDLLSRHHGFATGIHELEVRGGRDDAENARNCSVKRADRRLAKRLHQALMAGEYWAWGRPSDPAADHIRLCVAREGEQIILLGGGRFDRWPLGPVDFDSGTIAMLEGAAVYHDVCVCDSTFCGRDWEGAKPIGEAITLLEFEKYHPTLEAAFGNFDRMLDRLSVSVFGPGVDPLGGAVTRDRQIAMMRLCRYLLLGQLDMFVCPAGGRIWHRSIDLLRSKAYWQNKDRYLRPKSPDSELAFACRIYRRGDPEISSLERADDALRPFMTDVTNSTGRPNEVANVRLAFADLINSGSVDPRDTKGRIFQKIAILDSVMRALSENARVSQREIKEKRLSTKTVDRHISQKIDDWKSGTHPSFVRPSISFLDPTASLIKVKAP